MLMLSLAHASVVSLEPATGQAVMRIREMGRTEDRDLYIYLGREMEREIKRGGRGDVGKRRRQKER